MVRSDNDTLYPILRNKKILQYLLIFTCSDYDGHAWEEKQVSKPLDTSPCGNIGAPKKILLAAIPNA